MRLPALELLIDELQTLRAIFLKENPAAERSEAMFRDIPEARGSHQMKDKQTTLLGPKTRLSKPRGRAALFFSLY